MKKVIIIAMGVAFALTLAFHVGSPVTNSAGGTFTTNVAPGPGGGVGGN